MAMYVVSLRLSSWNYSLHGELKTGISAVSVSLLERPICVWWSVGVLSTVVTKRLWDLSWHLVRFADLLHPCSGQLSLLSLSGMRNE